MISDGTSRMLSKTMLATACIGDLAGSAPAPPRCCTAPRSFMSLRSRMSTDTPSLRASSLKRVSTSGEISTLIALVPDFLQALNAGHLRIPLSESGQTELVELFLPTTLREPANAGDRALAPGEAVLAEPGERGSNLRACGAGGRALVNHLCRQLRRLTRSSGRPQARLDYASPGASALSPAPAGSLEDAGFTQMLHTPSFRIIHQLRTTARRSP
jgi:hypothetical protein